MRLKLKLDHLPTPDQQAWLDKQFANYVEVKDENPCVKLYGPGPAGAKCKTCRLLFRKHFSRTYLKCELRDNTNGPGTDHKASWPACGRYQEAGQ